MLWLKANFVKLGTQVRQTEPQLISYIFLDSQTPTSSGCTWNPKLCVLLLLIFLLFFFFLAKSLANIRFFTIESIKLHKILGRMKVGML
jgi:hypothetical protein